MSDLISRSALIEVIKGFTNISRNYFSNPVLLEEIIENQPTAYDVGKVVEELEEAKGEIALNEDDLNIYCGALDDAIYIVRKGGVK